MPWQSNTLLAVMAILAGCSTVSVQDPGFSVPSEALQPCAEPSVDTRTNGGLARGVRDLRASLRACNLDKAILREALSGKGET